MEGPESHNLSPEAMTKIFNDEILPRDIIPIPPSLNPLNPLAILTLGQTGAGKTRLSTSILSSNIFIRHAGRDPSSSQEAGHKPAHLIADVYKTHHPSFKHLPPPKQSPTCGPAARTWLEMAASAAALKRTDVLLESACRHPEDFTSLAKIFHGAGYKIYVLVLAVPAALSRLGILVRYHGRLPEAGSGDLPVRLTPARVHDDSYEGLLRAVGHGIDKEELVDWVGVVRRNGLLAYEVRRNNERGFAGGVENAISKERARPLTEDETKIAHADIEALNGFDGTQDQVDAIKEVLTPLLNHGRGDYPELRPLNLNEYP